MESKKIRVKGNQKHATEEKCTVVTRAAPSEVLDNIARDKFRKEMNRLRKEDRDNYERVRRARKGDFRPVRTKK